LPGQTLVEHQVRI